MRTDCTIDLEGELRLPNIPIGSPGRRAWAKRGDVVEYRVGPTGPGESSWSFIGRVIGIVNAHDLREPHLCVAMLLRGSESCEMWITPSQVVDCYDLENVHTGVKALWLFSDAFLKTPVDMARNCHSYPTTELLNGGEQS